MPKFKLTETDALQALGLISEGLTNADVCRWLGVDESTFYAWLKKPKTAAQRQLSKGIEKARINRKAKCLRAIREAYQEKEAWQAAAWYLERVYPQEFAKPKRPEEDANAELIAAIEKLTETVEGGGA